MAWYGSCMLLLIASYHGKSPLDFVPVNSQLGVALDPKLGKSNNDINLEMTLSTLETTILCLFSVLRIYSRCVSQLNPLLQRTQRASSNNLDSRKRV